MRARIERELQYRRGPIVRRMLLLATLISTALALGITAPARATTPFEGCHLHSDGKWWCTYVQANNPGLFVVPDGITSVDVTVVGAHGQSGHTGHYCDTTFNLTGDGSPGGPGGMGAQVSGTLSVTPGEFLAVVAGSTGTRPLHGGAGGGGAVQATGSCPDYGGNGGDGGGASFISTLVNGGPDPTFLVVAAGGGGGGGGTDQGEEALNSPCGPGASGGDFGHNGGDRIEFYCTFDTTVPHSGGVSDANSNGIGGNGASATSLNIVGGGGGGGGGIHGAGGGTAGEIGGGAGGGGATSLVPNGFTIGAPSECTDVDTGCVIVRYADTTAPTTTISLTGTSQNGWYRGLFVTVSLVATDPDSVYAAGGNDIHETRWSLDQAKTFAQMGQTSLTSFKVANEGTHTVYTASQDFAGNTEVVHSASFKLDQEWPEGSISLSPSSPNGSNGWYTEPVGVSTSATDNLSGVAQTRCALDPASAPASYTALPSGSCAVSNVNSDGQHTVYAASQDVAGNNEPPETSMFKIDQTPPAAAPLISGSIGNNGWYTSDISLAWLWSDPTSGIDTNNCSTGAATSGEGTSLSVSGSCKDKAGNTGSDSLTFKVDKTKPTISAAPSPASPNGSNGWYTTNVTVHFTCGDNLSGVVNGTCPSDQTLSSEGSSVSSTAQTVSDNAGNTSSQSNVVTVKIDKTAPTVGVTGVTDGAQYTYGNVPAAGCTTNDGVSGVATPATVSITGGQNGAGSFLATCSGAVDKAGNQANPVSVAYTVLYAFGGYITPRPDGTIPYKPGTTTQVTFKLRDSSGQEISPAIESTLSGKLTAKLTGQGITPTSASCTWSSLLSRFQCSLPIPTLTHTGGSYPYQVTVYENLTGTPVVAPTFSNNPAVANPITVYFS